MSLLIFEKLKIKLIEENILYVHFFSSSFIPLNAKYYSNVLKTFFLSIKFIHIISNAQES